MSENTDKGFLVFSEDADVEEAQRLEKTVRNSLPSIGIVYDNKVILGSATRSHESELMEKDNLSSVFDVGDRAGMVSAGRLADAQSLTRQMRDKAMDDIQKYGQLEDVNVLVKEVAEDVRETRQELPYRSYGVSMIVGGVNGHGEAELYKIGIDGVVTSWSAVAIGSDADQIIHQLEEHYNELESFDDAISLTVDLLLEHSETTKDALSIGTITDEDGLERLNIDAINKYASNQGDEHE